MRTLWAVLAATCALYLSGCMGAPVTTQLQSGTNPVSGVALRGMVHGGQQPITGAHVYLYAANSGGYGGASNSLLTSGTKDGNNHYYVTTGAGGTFNISGDYTCPGSSTLVYLYAVGGDPSPGVPNAAAGLLAGLGSCNSPGFGSEYIVVNEVSTVATAFSLAGFATDTTHIASSSSSLASIGLADAFSGIANLESLSTGQALATTPAGNGTVPQSEINTLANILAACVNTNGSTAPTDPCGELFSYTTNGGSTPTDTAMAAINLAHNPGANVGSLYALGTGSGPFQPWLTSQPNDWTIAVTYSGGGLSYPYTLAIDGSDNVWVANLGGTGSISELGPLGNAKTGSTGITGGGLNEPEGLAIDIYGNIWTTNSSGNSLTEYSSTTRTMISGSGGFTGGGLNSPVGIAIDATGNIWVANFGGAAVSKFSSTTGQPLSVSGFSAGGLSSPYGIAADTAGNIWVSNFNPNTITELNSSGSAYGNSPISTGGLGLPEDVAVDGSGNIWVADNYGQALSEFNSTGTANMNSPFAGGGLSNSYGIAIDGSGSVWVANSGSISSISEFSSSGSAVSGANGYKSSALNYPVGLAVDGSGNVWVANSSASANGVTEFVGAASPVVTPLAAALTYGELGAKP